jgi:hypothetical protein
MAAVRTSINVCLLQRDYKALHRRKLLSSYTYTGKNKQIYKALTWTSRSRFNIIIDRKNEHVISLPWSPSFANISARLKSIENMDPNETKYQEPGEN